MLGLDFKFEDGNRNTTTFKERLQQLDQRAKGITVQALNDDDTGEIEHFVVQVTSAELYDDEKGKTTEVFAGNLMIVNITDDDSEYCSVLPLELPPSMFIFFLVYFSNSRWVCCHGIPS